jgi:clan AA aspartic protease (TIGR02281 family)
VGRVYVQLLAALLLAVPAGGGEIYRWTDEQGRTHFTQDLSQVPPKHRSRARASSSEDLGGSLVRSESSSPPARRDTSGSRSAGRRQVTRIQVQRAGTSMRVVAVLNGRVRAPFIVDTGASDVTIPRWVADELDIEVTSRTRRQVYQTANGRIEEPVVTLRSVDLGGAVAENVAASISSTMPVGLLGLSFFNRFRYQVDPQHGVITLEPNGLEEIGFLRGGRSQSEWRMQFRQLQGRRALVEARMGRLTPAHSRLLDELEGERDQIDEQIQDLEIEADRARVPHGWRE